MFESFLSFDYSVLHWIFEHLHVTANPVLDAIFVFITTLGDNGMFWIALALILLIPKKTRKAAAITAVALVLDVVITNGILKVLFDRPRPLAEEMSYWIQKYGYIWPDLVHVPHDASFPSGHTAASFAGAFGLFFGSNPIRNGSAKLRKASIGLMVLAALIGFSRLYVGVHYPTDVIAGVGVGVGCAALALLVFRLIDPLYEKCDAWMREKAGRFAKKKEKAE
jgi:undecaprenyl-diphosphatase